MSIKIYIFDKKTLHKYIYINISQYKLKNCIYVKQKTK